VGSLRSPSRTTGQIPDPAGALTKYKKCDIIELKGGREGPPPKPRAAFPIWA